MAHVKRVKKSLNISKVLKLLHPQELIELVQNLLFDFEYFWITASLLFMAEILLNVVVIWKVPYTEIDWKAYMSEVEGFLNGTYDYMKLEGGTGPLVYPAGFVYIFSALYFSTNHGHDIRFAQYLFVFLYLAVLLAVFYVYQKVQKIPPYALFFMCCTSYRIHSIFILRLFNDPVAMLFLYASIVFFIKNRWNIGCFLFSFGVSIKMNVLLFAPGLLVLLLLKFGVIGSIKKITICALVQLVLAIPFLLENPVAYIVRSFNLGRQFFFVWTVNWRFLPEWLFLSRWFHIILLCLHLFTLFVFLYKKWPPPSLGWCSIFSQKFIAEDVSTFTIVRVMFVSNFIGMSFARSLHYQFYVWYFHTIPFLLWNIKMSPVLKLLILGIVELCWNTYPSTNLSSVMLHGCHLAILLGLLFKEEEEASTKDKEK